MSWNCLSSLERGATNEHRHGGEEGRGFTGRLGSGIRFVEPPDLQGVAGGLIVDLGRTPERVRRTTLTDLATEDIGLWMCGHAPVGVESEGRLEFIPLPGSLPAFREVDSAPGQGGHR